MKMHISITAGIYSVYPVVFKVLVDLIVFMSLLFKLCPLTCGLPGYAIFLTSWAWMFSLLEVGLVGIFLKGMDGYDCRVSNFRPGIPRLFSGFP